MNASFRAMKVIKTKLLNEKSIWLELDQSIDAQPGQFIMAWLPGVGERPFSIAGQDPLSMLVVDVGPFSHALHQLKPGDLMWVKGPLGRGFKLSGESALLVGGGYGAAPLWPLAQLARKSGMRVQVCLGGKSQSNLLLTDSFKEIGCEVRVTTEDGSVGKTGLVTLLVNEALIDSRPDCLYACGPAGMLSSLASLAKLYNLPYQLSWEAYMRCGMGLCGSCEVPQTCDPALPPGLLACFDGPVFRYP